MANNLSGNAWRVDTASATPLSLLTATTFTQAGGDVYVSAIEFSGYAADTDKAIITQKNAAGVVTTVTTLTGKASLDPVSTNFGKSVWIKNIAVPTLTSGQVTIYLG